MTEVNAAKGPSWVGCMIPLTAVTVLLGLGTCTVVTGLRQDRAIGEFTETEPRWYGREAQVLDGEEAEAVEAKLTALREGAKSTESVEVRFSVGELNHLLQTSGLLASLKDTTRVVGVGKVGLEVESSQAMRKLGGGSRYLNGNFVFIPAASGTNRWQLDLLDLRVPGREVPEGFLKMARELRLFRFDLEAGGLQEVLQRVERMDLEDGVVVVATREE